MPRLLGVVTGTAYAWHLALMCLSALLALDLHQPRVKQAVLASLPVSLGLVLVSFVKHQPGLVSGAGLLAPLLARVTRRL